MAKTISTLAYAITADTRGFTQGIVATKKELSAAKQIIEATRTPTEKLGAAIAGVDQLLAKGAIDAATHGRAIDKLKSEFSDLQAAANPIASTLKTQQQSLSSLVNQYASGVPVVGRFTSLMSGGPILVGIAAAVASFAALAKGVSLATEKIGEQYKVLDELIDSAEKLSIAPAAFQDITKAAISADMEMSEVTKSIEQMLVSVSKGGSGKFAEMFGMLHLDAKALKAERPEQMLRDILSALEKIPNAADRAQIAKKIFGDQDILRMGAESLDEAARAIDAIGGHLSSMDVAALNEMEAAWKEMKFTTDVLFQRIAVDFAPVWTALAKDINETLVEIGGNETFTSLLETASQIALGMVESFDQAKGALSEMKDMLTELYEGGGVFKELIDGLKMLGQLRELRDALRANGIATPPDAAGDVKKITSGKPLGVDLELNPKFGMPGGGDIDRTTYAKDETEELIAKLREQSEELQRGAEGYQLYKEEMNGASEAQLGQIRALQDEIEAQKELNKLRNESKSALESLKSPYDKAREDIEKYAHMLEEGMIDQDQFGQLRDKRVKDFRSSQKSEEFRNPAMMRGSQEAIQALANAKYGSDNVQDDMANSLRSIDKKMDNVPLEVPAVDSFLH